MSERLSDTLDSIARMGTLNDFEKTALRQAARTIRASVGASIERDHTSELRSVLEMIRAEAKFCDDAGSFAEHIFRMADRALNAVSPTSPQQPLSSEET